MDSREPTPTTAAHLRIAATFWADGKVKSAEEMARVAWMLNEPDPSEREDR